jgi:hypothetical protein
MGLLSLHYSSSPKGGLGLSVRPNRLQGSSSLKESSDYKVLF